MVTSEWHADPATVKAFIAIQNPIDVTYDAKPQPTYLDYLKAANKR